MKRFVCISSVVILAFAMSMIPMIPATAQPAATFQGTYDTSTGLICPAGTMSVFVECWGEGGLTIGNSTYPTGGGGGGAYASATVSVIPGQRYNIHISASHVHFADERSGVLVKAESGKQGRTHNPFGAKGGQAANSIGTVKWSGGDGGSCFNVNGLDGFSNGLFYTCGGGGGGASPTGNGVNGANGTAIAPGAGAPGSGGNGGLGNQGLGATNGANATLLQSGGGAGGTGNSASGGKGLCKIS